MADMQEKAIDSVDATKANRIIRWLVNAEAENSKTNKLSDPEMIQKITKQIQGEVKCL